MVTFSFIQASHNGVKVFLKLHQNIYESKMSPNILRISLCLRLKFYNLIYCSYSLLICTLRSDFEGGRKVVLQPEKRWVYRIHPPIFLGLKPEKKSEFSKSLFSILKKIRVYRTTFLPPSKSLLRVQIKRMNVLHCLLAKHEFSRYLYFNDKAFTNTWDITQQSVYAALCTQRGEIIFEFSYRHSPA